MYWCVCVGDRELITFLNALAATRAPGCLPRREGPKFPRHAISSSSCSSERARKVRATGRCQAVADMNMKCSQNAGCDVGGSLPSSSAGLVTREPRT